jgi:uncharacterized membrane protein
MQNKKTMMIVQTAIIAAMYTALTYAQNFLLPGTTSAAVQFRASEALNVLALFTPVAIPGLTLGCILSNIYNVGSGLPLDMIFGSLAPLGGSICRYYLRNLKIKNSASCNAYACYLDRRTRRMEIEYFFVDGDFIFGDFLFWADCVALGELGLGSFSAALYFANH